MKAIIIKSILLSVIVFCFQSCEKSQDSFYADFEGLYKCRAIYQEIDFVLDPTDTFSPVFETEEKDTVIHLNQSLGNIFTLPDINENLYFSYQENDSLVLINESYRPESDPIGFGITGGVLFEDSLRFTYQRISANSSSIEIYIAGDFYCVKQ